MFNVALVLYDVGVGVGVGSVLARSTNFGHFDQI